MYVNEAKSHNILCIYTPLSTHTREHTSAYFTHQRKFLVQNILSDTSWHNHLTMNKILCWGQNQPYILHLQHYLSLCNTALTRMMKTQYTGFDFLASNVMTLSYFHEWNANLPSDLNVLHHFGGRTTLLIPSGTKVLFQY